MSSVCLRDYVSVIERALVNEVCMLYMECVCIFCKEDSYFMFGQTRIEHNSSSEYRRQ